MNDFPDAPAPALISYPKSKVEDGETSWSLLDTDETLTTARELLDSALLRSNRKLRP